MSDLRASVLISTHDHAATLPWAVRSVLRQTLTDIEVVIIGDGVTEATRAAAEGLVVEDPRVRFLDFPKGPHHGEIYRHEAILAARSDAILYLCDDDLLLPEHAFDMVGLLAQAHLAQCRNGYFDSAGRLELYPTDLADPVAVAWHLAEPRRNMVSLTGTAHSRDFYLALGSPWETTPAGQWPDHYMWKKFFRHPGFVGATSRRMTALQFPTSTDGRDAWSEAERREELRPWAELVARPDAQRVIDSLVEQAVWQRVHRDVRALDHTRREAARAEALLAQVAALRAEVRALTDSRSMRVTKPLRDLRCWGARLLRS